MEWRVINGNSDYEVSDAGQVRTWKVRDYSSGHLQYVRGSHPTLMNPTLHNKGRTNYGYYVVDIGYTQRYVHLLVLEMFRGACPPGLEGCHNDGNSLNNALSNLRWDTHENNMQDAVKQETIIRGEKQHNSKLTDAIVLSVRERYAAGGVTQTELANEYGISQYSMRRVLVGTTWTHVGGPRTKTGKGSRQRGWR